MIDQLDKAIKVLPKYLGGSLVWDSLVINKRKPHTYRAFMFPKDEGLEGTRICLHRFEPCDESDAFLHPHPWPSAMVVLRGEYRMKIGASPDSKSSPVIVLDEILAKGSKYSMTSPLGWHAVQPLTTCYSIMINGQPWDGSVAHEKAPTTKGKDLAKMTVDELGDHIRAFDLLIGDLL